MAETTTVSTVTLILKIIGIIDSGCDHHLTSNASKFSSLENYGGKDAIIKADNTIYPVEKEGSISFTNEADPSL